VEDQLGLSEDVRAGVKQGHLLEYEEKNESFDKIQLTAAAVEIEVHSSTY
jgi:hypothetical protein